VSNGVRQATIYRARSPISCGGGSLSHKEVEFQLGSLMHHDSKIFILIWGKVS
jgi:hypothetical protein